MKPRISLRRGGINYGDLVEFLYDARGQLNMVIRGFIEVDSLLNQVIGKWVLVPEALKGNRIPFPDKVNLAVAIGALKPPDAPAFKALGKLRNDFAHRKPARFTKKTFRLIEAGLSPVQRKFLTVFPRPRDYHARLFNFVLVLLFHLDYIRGAQDKSITFVKKGSVKREFDRTVLPLLVAEHRKHPLIAPQIII